MMKMEEDSVLPCRICLDDQGHLFHPCACTGTMKNVHAECADQARKLQVRIDALYVCDVCKTEYNLSYSNPFLNYIFLILEVINIFIIFYALPYAIWGLQLLRSLGFCTFVVTTIFFTFFVDKCSSTISSVKKSIFVKRFEEFQAILFLIEVSLFVLTALEVLFG